MNLIIFGPPGSGKGTQSAFLVNDYHFVHIATGHLLRAEIVKATALGIAIKDFVGRGNYVSDAIINQVVAANLKAGNNHVFDGYPRTMNQVKFLEAVLASIKQQIDLVIYLQINKNNIKKRLLERLFCPSCQQTYNKLFLPPKKTGVCDDDQTKLIVRTDDSDLVKIKTRLQEYDSSTKPLLSYFKRQGILKIIDANESTSSIRKKIATLLMLKEKDTHDDY